MGSSTVSPYYLYMLRIFLITPNIYDPGVYDQKFIPETRDLSLWISRHLIARLSCVNGVDKGSLSQWWCNMYGSKMAAADFLFLRFDDGS